MKHFDNLFDRFTEQTLNRRQMIQACAVAAASAAVPAFAADAGLKAVWANHYTYVAPDLKKTRDWYHEVYGMQIKRPARTLMGSGWSSIFQSVW